MQRKLLPALLICVMVFAGCHSIATASPGMPKGVVLFSFDDGPNAHADTTLRLLKILENYNIKGEFALLGVNAEHNPELVRRIAAGGHTIVNHGYGERFSVFMNDEAFRANLTAGERAIGAALGKEACYPLVYRPQGGFFTSAQKKLWGERGYRFAVCSVRMFDAAMFEKDKDRIVRDVVRRIEKHNGGIVLLHDAKNAYTTMEAGLKRNPKGSYNRDWIPGAVEEIILALREKEYQLSDVDLASIGAFHE